MENLNMGGQQAIAHKIAAVDSIVDHLNAKLNTRL